MLNLYSIVLLSLFFILGAVLGSGFLCFLDRRHRKECWTKGRSKCVACGHELHSKDLIPILSYLLLKGKCRYCGKPYSAATLLSEVTMGFAGMFIYINLMVLNQPFGLDAVICAGIYLLLGFGAVNDIYCHECEFVLQYSICGAGLFLSYRNEGLIAALICLGSGVVVYLVGILVMYLKKKYEKIEDDYESAIGLADIVVMVGISGMVGYRYLTFIWLYASVITLFLMCIMYITKLAQKLHPDEPYIGLGFLPGSLFAAFLGQLTTFIIKL